MFRHDQNHSGYTDNAPSKYVKSLWNYTTGAAVWSTPAVVEGCVFVGSRDGNLFCLNATDGLPLWNYQTGSVIEFCSPTVMDGCVYFGTVDRNVFCLDVVTGMPYWIAPLGDTVRSSPAVADDRLFVGCSDHRLYCLNASTGAKLWSYLTSDIVDSSPAVVDGVVYVGSIDNSIYAFDAVTGTKLWSQHTGSGVISSPAVQYDHVYFGSIDGAVYALNASTGDKLWKYQTESSVTSSPAVAEGRVYIGSQDSNLYCLDAFTGEKVWTAPTGYWVWSSPAVANGNVYVGSEDHNIYCFNASTGAKKWSYPTGNAVDSSPALAYGNIYIGSSDFTLYALTDSPTPTDYASSDSVPQTVILFDLIAATLLASTVFGFAFCMRSNLKFSRLTLNGMNYHRIALWAASHADAASVIAILAFSSIFFVGSGSGHLWVADEQTYSQWAFHILKTGDYLTPWAFGGLALWMGKPPLFMWLMSLSYQVFGVTNFAARFWSAIFGTLSCVVVFYMGKHLYNRRVGLLSAVVLGTFATFFLFARHAMTDVPLVFFMLASIYFMLISEKSPRATWLAALSGLFFGLALMTKQLQAMLIPLIIVFYLLVTKKSLRFLFTKRFTLFWGAALLVFSPWIIYMYSRFGSDFFYWFFLYSNVERSIGALERHVGNYLYYFNYMLYNENPLWVAILPVAAGLCVFNSVVKRLKADILLLIWALIVLLVFTFAQTKLHWYIIPALPAFAIAASSFLYQLSKRVKPKKN